jgi:transcriptional regulator with XRE-family HTH domain
MHQTDMSSHVLLEGIGRAIRRRREELGLSQESFAARCDLHRTYITSVETGRRNVSVDTLSKVAAALSVAVSELVAEGERLGAATTRKRIKADK